MCECVCTRACTSVCVVYLCDEKKITAMTYDQVELSVCFVLTFFCEFFWLNMYSNLAFPNFSLVNIILKIRHTICDYVIQFHD